MYAEIKIYGHEDPRKKLIAGIVLTGGGSQLNHIKQLVEYITGMDTRIGYPNEHLAGNSSEEISSPLYATAVGLVMNSIRNNTISAVPQDNFIPEPVLIQKPTIAEQVEIQQEAEKVFEETKADSKSTEKMIRKSFFDKYIDKIKDFLDNAE